MGNFYLDSRPSSNDQHFINFISQRRFEIVKTFNYRKEENGFRESQHPTLNGNRRRVGDTTQQETRKNAEVLKCLTLFTCISCVCRAKQNGARIQISRLRNKKKLRMKYQDNDNQNWITAPSSIRFERGEEKATNIFLLHPSRRYSTTQPIFFRNFNLATLKKKVWCVRLSSRFNIIFFYPFIHTHFTIFVKAFCVFVTSSRSSKHTPNNIVEKNVRVSTLEISMLAFCEF